MSALEHAATLLRIVGHPHRLKIIELLKESELAVGELAERVGLAPHATSQHLNIMKAHDILGSRRESRNVYYFVKSPHALNIIDCIRKNLD
jgi:ArsR family transcriptional regulator